LAAAGRGGGSLPGRGWGTAGGGRSSRGRQQRRR
jgi:hypothetical protein